MLEGILWLVINLFYEANGEPEEAQLAVVVVVLNRADWDLEKVPAVVQKHRQFSWALDKTKLATAKRLVKDQEIPESMKNLVRIVYKALNLPFFKRPDWDHYKAITRTASWGCYPGGRTTVIIPGSGHVFCNTVDVVKPGRIPSYFKSRKKRRAWRAKKAGKETDHGGC